jgi:hypothetical protein
MIPTECRLDDLRELAAEHLKGRAILHLFIGDSGLNRKEVIYRRNFARLIDKAIYEYQMARQALLAELAERDRPAEEMARQGRQLFILGFVDHFENCLNAINRALKLFECLSGEAIASGIPRLLRRSLDAFSRSVKDVRDTFEHVDERIQQGLIADGQPIMLSIGGDGDRAVIGADEVTFADVARTLRKLHEIGRLLFDSGHDRPASADVDAASPGETMVFSGKTSIAVSRVGEAGA